MKCSILLLGLLIPVFLFAQKDDFKWWNAKHQWNGYTHWSQMMKIRPAFLGPNALPVPEIKQAHISDEWRIELRQENHLAKGDQTYNIYGSVTAPLGKNANFEVFVVPLEYYQISDTNIRDMRVIRSLNPKGLSGGDIWFGTNIQLVRDHERFSNLMLSAYCKTASGLNLNDARYTDAPAYHFQLSMGSKKVSEPQSSQLKVHAYGHLGVFIWQQYDVENLQDDAILYGFGMQITKSRIIWNNEVGGYYGYFNNGDRPLVIRSKITYQLKSKLNLALAYQIGLNDYPYQTIALSLARYFKIK